MTPMGPIRALNAGSSSLKFALFHAGKEMGVALRGEIEDMANAPKLLARDAQGAVIAEQHWPPGAAPKFADLLGPLMRLVEPHQCCATIRMRLSPRSSRYTTRVPGVWLE